MNDPTKRKRLQRYFSKSQPLLALFVLLAMAAVVASVVLRIPAVGVLILAVVCLWLFVKALRRSMRLSDKTVDEWFNEDKERIAESSLDKLGLIADQVRRTLTLTGPILWPTNGVPHKDLRWKKGKDRELRLAVNRVTVIHLTDQMLSVYSCDFNSLKNRILNEETEEYYYRDIVSVSTAELSSDHKLPGGKSLAQARAFRISVVSGEGLEVIISLPTLSKRTGGTIPTSDAENAVRMIRTMLRDKK
ncbi:MAG TPA: hypothetical protein VEV42_14810 [Pyrinomonadaceae bacterium]|jgi:hypothetical protein|nr:hypothetical protein [Pyrinomonadaceae bacterium]